MADRDIHLDSIAGLLIVVMVAGHCGAICFDPYTVGQAIGGFYMGWFFYKSGLFHKKRSLTVALIKKWSLRLVVPYIVFSLFGLVIALLRSQFDTDYSYTVTQFVKDVLLMGFPLCNSPLWFLLTLFCVRLITVGVEGKSFRWLFVVSLIMAILHEHFFTPFRFVYIGNIALATTCYALGAMIGKRRISTAIFLGLLAIDVLLFIYSPSCINFGRNHTFFGNYIASITAAIFGMLIVNELFHRVRLLQSRPLAYLSRVAMPILVIHFPIWLSIKPIGAWGGVIVCLALPIVFYEALKKYRAIRFIFGER